MSFTLKNYQRRVLSRLGEFFNLVRLRGVEDAYKQVAHRTNEDGRKENPYAKPTYAPVVAGLECPHVCVRVPTGGGKTYLAAVALKNAARYVENEHPLVLWIVPSDTIRHQTVAMLKNRDHPCRATLEKELDDNVLVFDVEDSPPNAQDLAQRSCIIVTTAAKFRIGRESKSKRQVHATNEEFQPHFEYFLPPTPPPALERDEQGAVKYSFINLLHLLRPVVVVDEAHNFVSVLSGEVLQRLNPSCIMEWTATPRDSQDKMLHNVLVNVTAAELEAEEMVKLPIMVTEHTDWEGAVGGAVAERKRLAAAAADSGDSVRPLVLYQAQNKNESVPPQALKEHLINAQGVREEKIAIATGNVRDIDGVDLMAADCPVEHIITVQALREGWDCPYAYVLCSVAHVHSATAIEQLMGRVMRMPQARRRRDDALNRAYAHVPKGNINSAVESMREKLAVGLGFEEYEAKWIVQSGLLSEELEDGTALENGASGVLFAEPAAEYETTTAPDFSNLSEATQQQIKQAMEVIRLPPSSLTQNYKVVVHQALPEEVQRQIIAAMPEDVRENEQTRMRQENKRLVQVTAKPRQRAFASLPLMLFYSSEENREVVATAETLYQVAAWNDLPDNCLIDEFRIEETATTFSISTKDGKVLYENKGKYDMPSLLQDDEPPDRNYLASWLEREIRDRQGRYLPETLKSLINANLDNLLKQHPLPLLYRVRYQLAEALRNFLIKHEQKVAKHTASLFLLDNDDARCEFSFHFPANILRGAGEKPYDGSYIFKKHHTPFIGAFDNDEESECARLLDSHEQVRRWFRNPSRKPYSYSLPFDAQYNFFPDFVVELSNGKTLVVEYKGGHLYSNDDSKRKRRIGEKMEELAAGECFFIMVGNRKGAPLLKQQIDDKLSAIKRATIAHC